MQHWPAEAIWEAVVPWLPGFTVEVLPELDSTNAELMRRARAGQLEPVLLVAEHQTAGRGRLGRAWHSDASQAGARPDAHADVMAGPQARGSLTFSLGLPLAVREWSGLSLAVGVSLAQSIHPNLQLKWPNDLWLAGRKLGGILIETAQVGAQRYVVVGVGVNIAAPLAQGLSTPPAWWRELAPDITPPAALLRLVPPLVQALLRFAEQGFAPFEAGFAQRDALAGCAVRLSDGLEGIASGVDAQGALRVQTRNGPVRVNSAEVSVRPLEGASP